MGKSVHWLSLNGVPLYVVLMEFKYVDLLLFWCVNLLILFMHLNRTSNCHLFLFDWWFNVRPSDFVVYSSSGKALGVLIITDMKPLLRAACELIILTSRIWLRQKFIPLGESRLHVFFKR